MKRIFFIVPHPLKLSPSQRFRFEQYLPLLQDQGYEFRVASFLNETNWKTFYDTGKVANKALTLASATVKRMRSLSAIRDFDFVFIHREALPVGPPVLEWLITKLLRKKIIYDFDDAIWLTDQQNETFIRRLAKWRHKVGQICRLAYKVSCGNKHLCNYARTFNARVVYNPTIVDTNNRHNPIRFAAKKNPDVLTIGWTGSHSTIKYLTLIEETLKHIENANSRVRILIIADRRPDTFPLCSFDFIEWNPDTEIEDLMKIDIGVMPLPDDEWAKGKCGFKIIQFMALKIPVVAAAVGVNTTIVDHGRDGFLAATQKDWDSHLNHLISNDSLRISMGENGRKKVVNQYSVDSNAFSFLSLFE